MKKLITVKHNNKIKLAVHATQIGKIRKPYRYLRLRSLGNRLVVSVFIMLNGFSWARPIGGFL
jgi:predicted permease